MHEAMPKARKGCRIFTMHCKNFTTIPKISQSLRKFCYARFFAKLAKFRYHSEIFSMIAKFTA